MAALLVGKHAAPESGPDVALPKVLSCKELRTPHHGRWQHCGDVSGSRLPTPKAFGGSQPIELPRHSTAAGPLSSRRWGGYGCVAAMLSIRD